VDPHVNMHEAKTHFSKLVQRAEQGQETVIARAGKPVAKLVPYEKPPARRRLGGWEGKVLIHDDFEADLPEDLLRPFEGKEP
jgi:prevent-host-death family protein